MAVIAPRLAITCVASESSVPSGLPLENSTAQGPQSARLGGNLPPSRLVVAAQSLDDACFAARHRRCRPVAAHRVSCGDSKTEQGLVQFFVESKIGHHDMLIIRILDRSIILNPYGLSRGVVDPHRERKSALRGDKTRDPLALQLLLSQFLVGLVAQLLQGSATMPGIPRRQFGLVPASPGRRPIARFRILDECDSYASGSIKDRHNSAGFPIRESPFPALRPSSAMNYLGSDGLLLPLNRHQLGIRHRTRLAQLPDRLAEGRRGCFDRQGQAGLPYPR